MDLHVDLVRDFRDDEGHALAPFLTSFMVVFFLTPHSAFALKSEFQREIDRMIRESRIPRKHLSIRIGSAFAPPIYQLNEDTKRVPASLTKLITASMVHRVYWRLQPSLPTTRLESRGRIEKGTLKGHLILRGGGDAGFVSEDMWRLVNEFRRTGIRKIEGDIVVDDSLFDTVRFDESRRDKRVDRAYDAPVGAMSFNWNTANVFVRPFAAIAKSGESKGPKSGTAQVTIDPESEFVSTAGQIRIGAKTRGLSVRRKTQDSRDVITLSGTLAKDASEKVFYRSVSDPAMWSGYALKSFLQQRSIFLTGAVRHDKVEPATVYASVESKPMSRLIADMQKFSNNYVAEMLVKLASTWSGAKPGTMEAGTAVLQKELRSFGWKTGEYSYINPSGLSRKNLFTVYQIFQVLERMGGDFEIGSEAISALPRSGFDGTLKKRIGAPELRGRVRAKTGYLSGVVGLAGYVPGQESSQKSLGAHRIFVFLYNGPSQKDSGAKALFDRLASFLGRGT